MRESWIQLRDHTPLKLENTSFLSQKGLLLREIICPCKMYALLISSNQNAICWNFYKHANCYCQQRNNFHISLKISTSIVINTGRSYLHILTLEEQIYTYFFMIALCHLENGLFSLNYNILTQLLYNTIVGIHSKNGVS